MNDDDFLCAELGMIPVDELEAYSPDDFQREFLSALEAGAVARDRQKTRSALLEIAARHNRLNRDSKGDWTVPNTWEHFGMIAQIRNAREAGKGQLKTAMDSLQRILRPAFEFTKQVHDEHDDFYDEDLKRRWEIAGNACGWDGALRYDACGRFIALTQSPIWTQLGNADDGLGINYPPFYANGGWRFHWRTVKRDECQRLGLVAN